MHVYLLIQFFWVGCCHDLIEVGTTFLNERRLPKFILMAGIPCSNLHRLSNLWWNIRWIVCMILVRIHTNEGIENGAEVH